MEFKDFVNNLMGVLRIRFSRLNVKGQDNRDFEVDSNKVVTGVDGNGSLITVEEKGLRILECGHPLKEIRDIRQCQICGRFGCKDCIEKCIMTEIWVCSSLECSRIYQMETGNEILTFRVSHEGYEILTEWEKEKKRKRFFLSLIGLNKERKVDNDKESS